MEHLIAAEENGNKLTPCTCKAALEEVNKSDDNCPIVLKKITFDVFSQYVSTKNSKQYEGYLSNTSYGRVQSYLTHLYCMSGKTMGGELKKELSQPKKLAL